MDSQTQEATLEELEAQAEVIESALHKFCNELDSQGLDPMVLNTVLFTAFIDRMLELGLIEELSEMLESVDLDDVDVITLH